MGYEPVFLERVKGRHIASFNSIYVLTGLELPSMHFEVSCIWCTFPSLVPTMIALLQEMYPEILCDVC